MNFYLSFIVIDQSTLAVAFQAGIILSYTTCLMMMIMLLQNIYPGLAALQRIYSVCSNFLPQSLEGGGGGRYHQRAS